MRNPSKQRCEKDAEIVDDIYLAYVRALSKTSDADLADFVAEYTASPDSAAIRDEVRHLPDKVRTPRKGIAAPAQVIESQLSIARTAGMERVVVVDASGSDTARDLRSELAQHLRGRLRSERSA